ncbi:MULTISPECIES: tyrosine-type recombinase/integrase [Mycobacterium]|uniref:Phage integrase family protein n=1 Tax=Mycobacterium intracellulare 1956 TaxID=1299331 RepID=X8CHV3_MYCIT|nr:MULTISPECIES: site-specific integrase [Mycobacterium]EUA31992.1 phage integrase family protein [Mycobacterium intracellulare]EUA55391.1 phage integrase family protein [Mycobacterium intracellulare 1956]UQB90886.1 site-specific integrase [Mycobacterium intracellulare]WSE48423.1 tyrosine-type recombinase/integrase [Mycobacterium sp. 3-98]
MPGTFGAVHQLPSGRYRAMYYGPDGRRYKAPTTFTTQTAARKWLALRQAEIVRHAWEPPEAQEAAPNPRLTFKVYADAWIKHRDLKIRTREHYEKLLEDHILGKFGSLPIASVTADDVRNWYAATLADRPTMRSHAYGLLRTIFGDAVRDGKAPANPCVLRGAGSAKRVHKIRPASFEELDVIIGELPERYRMMIPLASWCAMRYGEITELRRGDIDLEGGVIRIRRGVVRTDDGFKVGPPKSDAGVRDVHIPPHLLPALEGHLAKHVEASDTSLMFPAQSGEHLAPATFYRHYYRARTKAKRPDLRFHDLRHSGAVFAAATGATLAELMARLGHSTPAAALRYQHAAQGADKRIADALSRLLEASSSPKV